MQSITANFSTTRSILENPFIFYMQAYAKLNFESGKTIYTAGNSTYLWDFTAAQFEIRGN